jgi:hypothetical protein
LLGYFFNEIGCWGGNNITSGRTGIDDEIGGEDPLSNQKRGRILGRGIRSGDAAQRCTLNGCNHGDRRNRKCNLGGRALPREVPTSWSARHTRGRGPASTAAAAEVSGAGGLSTGDGTFSTAVPDSNWQTNLSSKSVAVACISGATSAASPAEVAGAGVTTTAGGEKSSAAAHAVVAELEGVVAGAVVSAAASEHKASSGAEVPSAKFTVVPGGGDISTPTGPTVGSPRTEAAGSTRAGTERGVIGAGSEASTAAAAPSAMKGDTNIATASGTHFDSLANRVDDGLPAVAGGANAHGAQGVASGGVPAAKGMWAQPRVDWAGPGPRRSRATTSRRSRGRS